MTSPTTQSRLLASSHAVASARGFASSPFHSMQDHGSFPAASHSSAAFLPAPRTEGFDCEHQGVAQPDHCARSVVSLSHGSPRGLVRSIRAFRAALVGRLI